MRAEETIATKYQQLSPVMDERMRRLWAGTEALAYGPGGISLVAAATGLSRSTIRSGIRALEAGVSRDTVVQVRRSGGGRKPLEHDDPALLEALERLVEPVSYGESLTYNGQPYGGESVRPSYLRCFACTDYDVSASSGVGGYYTSYWHGRWMLY